MGCGKGGIFADNGLIVLIIIIIILFGGIAMND